MGTWLNAYVWPWGMVSWDGAMYLASPTASGAAMLGLMAVILGVVAFSEQDTA